MSLNRKDLNALSVLGVRKLTFIPKHFTRVAITEYADTNNIESWVEYNLNSRYAFGRSTIVNSENKTEDIIELGLEDPKEAMIMMMGCPYIHKK